MTHDSFNLRPVNLHLMLFQSLESVIQYAHQDSLVGPPQVLSVQKMHQPADTKGSYNRITNIKQQNWHLIILTLVFIDFSRSCLFIDLTIFDTSCFSSHFGLHNKAIRHNALTTTLLKQ